MCYLYGSFSKRTFERRTTPLFAPEVMTCTSTLNFPNLSHREIFDQGFTDHFILGSPNVSAVPILVLNRKIHSARQLPVPVRPDQVHRPDVRLESDCSSSFSSSFYFVDVLPRQASVPLVLGFAGRGPSKCASSFDLEIQPRSVGHLPWTVWTLIHHWSSNAWSFLCFLGFEEKKGQRWQLT